MELYDVMLIGEPMLMFVNVDKTEVQENSTFSMKFAGAELNVAVGLARLGKKPYFVTKVGKDMFSSLLIRKLENEGINSKIISSDLQKTGVQIKITCENSESLIHYYRSNSAFTSFELSEFPMNDVSRSKSLHLTSIPISVSKSFKDIYDKLICEFKETERPIFFDPNIRSILWEDRELMINIINEVAYSSDYFMPGITEASALCGLTEPNMIADYYLSRGTKNVVIKLGDRGAYFKNNGFEFYEEPYSIPSVVDTVGAGDGFAAGFISSILSYEDVRIAVKKGVIVGALAVQNIGDHEGYPEESELNEILFRKGDSHASKRSCK